MAVVYNRHTSSGVQIDTDESANGEDRQPQGSEAFQERSVWDVRPTETQRVYQALKRAILAGQFRPGEPLQETRIAAEFGASRTPVREAFHKLESDGLLTNAPRRGAFVQQPTARDFFDANELRLLLEPIAARKAAFNLSEATIRDLQARLQAISIQDPTEDDFRALEVLDPLMHSTIATCIENVRMGKIIQSLNDLMQIVRETDMRRRHAEMHTSIGEILDALAARDPDLSESLMRNHIADFSGALRSLV